MATNETKVFGSIHEDPNFAVICSFISRYGTLLGLQDISFDALEKWIEDQRYMNDSIKDLLVKLLKRWKSSVNEDRLHQYLIKFCHTYSQVDAWEVESCGFQRCKTATKLRVIKTLMEQQFDSNTKFKEKLNEVPATELRCLPIGKDMTGKAYWFLVDKEMNIRIYSEEQDDVQSETWQIVVSDRNQLANLITTLEELKGKLNEKSRSATPSTVISESNRSDADCYQSFVIPESLQIIHEAESAQEKAEEVSLKLDPESFSSIGTVKKEPQEIDFFTSESFKEEKQDQETMLSEIKVSPDMSKDVRVEFEKCKEDTKLLTTEVESRSFRLPTVKDELLTKIEEKECSEIDTLNNHRNERRFDASCEDASERAVPDTVALENAGYGKECSELNTLVIHTNERSVIKAGPSTVALEKADDRKETPSEVKQKSVIKAKLPSFSEETILTPAKTLDASDHEQELAIKPKILENNQAELNANSKQTIEMPVVENVQRLCSSSTDKMFQTPDFTHCTDSGCTSPGVEGHHQTEKTDSVSDVKTRVSVKRKHCDAINQNSSTEADSAHSDSELSETLPESKMLSSGEEPPSKRQRNKALKTVAERDRLAGRVKEKKCCDASEKDKEIDVLTEGISKSMSEKDLTNVQTIHQLQEISCDEGAAKNIITTNEEYQPEEPLIVECESREVKLDSDQNKLVVEVKSGTVNQKKVAGRVGRKARKQKRAVQRKVQLEEKENGMEKKGENKGVTSQRGRKKRGLKPSTNQESEIDYEPNNKLVRPENLDEKQNELKSGAGGSGCVSEDDIPLIELRRSTRANKGQRKFEPLVVPEPKKRRRIVELQDDKNRKKIELEEKKLKKEAELALMAKIKKKRRGKNDSDDDFVPGKVSARKAKGRNRGRKEGSEDESEDLEEDLFEPESEEESLHFSASSSDELESDGSVYEPKGRNAKRAAALNENSQPDAKVQDQPCTKCGKSDQPEWLLLCDRCEAGYHTACLRPPLLAIPEGDWFCPPCEHSSLIEKLQEQLIDYDKKAKQNVRLLQRKERLAFVGISLSNILPIQERRSFSKNPDVFDDERDEEATEGENESKDTEDETEDTEEEEEGELDEEEENQSPKPSHTRLRQLPTERIHKNRRQAPSPSEQSLSDEVTDESGDDNWLSGRRSRRQRKEISYKFEEFDELINTAIKDDVKDSKGVVNVPVVNTGRGKDMSNMTGIPDSDEDDHATNGKRKKRRNLTRLDSNDEEQDDDDDESEEYHISEDDMSSASAEEDTVDADEESDDWQIGREPRGRVRAKQGGRHSRRSLKRFSVYDDDFVVEEYDSEDDQPSRRVRRTAAQRKINYHEDSDESDASQQETKKKPVHSFRLCSDESEEDAKENLGKKRRKKTKGDSGSEYVPSADEEFMAKKVSFHKHLESDSDELSSEKTVSRKKGKLNVIESSEEEEEKEVEEEGEAEQEKKEGENTAQEYVALKQNQHIDKKMNLGLLGDPESVTSADIRCSADNDSITKIVDSVVCASVSKSETTTINGHCNVTSLNGNTESHNNHNFSIANLLKTSDRRPAVTSHNTDLENPDVSPASREDSLTDVLDLVEYVTQGESA